MDAGAGPEGSAVTDEDEMAVRHDELAADGRQDGFDFLAWFEDWLKGCPGVLGQ